MNTAVMTFQRLLIKQERKYGKEILDTFHLQQIPADEIILSPELLK